MDGNEVAIGIQSNCTICLGNLVQKDKVSALICGHIYHHACISLWIAEKNQCPKCRRSVPKNGFVERLYFDTAGSGGVEPNQIQQIDYAEMSCKLTEDLKAEKVKTENLEVENKKLKTNVKALEKKVLREKDINEKEIPRLKSTIGVMSMAMEETDYYKKQFQKANDKLKACEFYSLLNTHGSDADEKLSEFLKSNGGVHHEKFFEFIKAKNKELTESRKAARDEAQKWREDYFSMKKQLDESMKNVKNLKDEVLSLRDRARVETPINKRLRDVMSAETPTVAKRRSLGFDDTRADLYGDDWSYFQPVSKDEEVPKPCLPKEPVVEKFSFDADSDDDDVFKRAGATMQLGKKKIADDSFEDSDIRLPPNIIKRIQNDQLAKNRQKTALKKSSSQNFKMTGNTKALIKTARLSSFFPRKQSSDVNNEDCVTLD